MKFPIVTPLFFGLILAGCTSTRTHSNQFSSPAPSTTRQPLLAVDQTAEARAETLRKVDAEMHATADSTPAAAPAKDESTKPAPMIIPASTQPLSPDPASLTPTAVAPAITSPNLPLSDRITQWKLTPEDIKAELEQTGRVLRLKTSTPGEPTGPMDPTLLDQINGKLKADPETAALAIKVEVDTRIVTLNGSAHSLEQIGRAVAIALDTGGVIQIISLIKLDSAPQP